MRAAGTALAELDATGAFVRQPSVFRRIVGQQDGPPAEAGRYHLIISLACPWANRCLTTMNLKGLGHAIGLSVVHPTWQPTRPEKPEDTHCGWTFAKPTDPNMSSPTGHGSFPCDGCIPLPSSLGDLKNVRDLYDLSKSVGQKFTVPVLWDLKEKVIVNNESEDIVRMLNSAFNSLAKNPSLDLYPEGLRTQINEVNEWVYHGINNGVYKCGFASKQATYEQAFKELFAALDKAEGILTTQRFLVGGQLTEADVRLFQTLIRFDEVYVVYFKTNHKRIQDYPALSCYVRDLFSMPEIARSIDLRHIKTHYYTSHPILNAYAIIPVGGEAWWTVPCPDRAKV
eukprot:CAMPEP_0119110432 /NCGR_PEP_ID=MMETSP1180-20130426/29640_1 /TAXON_ID=3052 ORGANISM="Chlamydomonas cf sp, Strain CCMP681" /NCGR_SAMPLE_ID=MMETSP1180 /ASSEMBLY_ACC=CAM_ASM_000741 /LENGTH=340 /DNA_ID=CAMNT_0007096777 /DNA_START=12 /DNA_END=1034 /DNA_ORIENTATION=-